MLALMNRIGVWVVAFSLLWNVPVVHATRAMDLGGLREYGIGSPVIGGTANSVLFIDSSGNIAQDNPGFTYVAGTGLSLDDTLVVTGTGRFDTGLIDSLGNTSVDIEGHTLGDTGGATRVDYNNGQLFANDGSDIILDFDTIGTAQFVNSNIITTGTLGAAATTLTGVTTITAAVAALDVQNTFNGNNQVAIFRGGNRAAGADGQNAYLSFFLDDDTETQAEFARMFWFAGDASTANKDGEFRFEVQSDNVWQEILHLKENSVAVNDDGQDVNFRVEGTGLTSLFFTDAGKDNIGIGHSNTASFSLLDARKGTPSQLTSTSDLLAQFSLESTETSVFALGMAIFANQDNTSTNTTTTMGLNAFGYHKGSAGLTRTTDPGGLLGGRYAARVDSDSQTIAYAVGSAHTVRIENTQTSTVTRAVSILMEAMDAEDGTITTGYGLYGRNSLVSKVFSRSDIAAVEFLFISLSESTGKYVNATKSPIAKFSTICSRFLFSTPCNEKAFPILISGCFSFNRSYTLLKSSA